MIAENCYFERESACVFKRLRNSKSNIGRFDLSTIPISSAPICKQKVRTQMTAKVIQFAACDCVSVDCRMAQPPKNAAIPQMISTVLR